MRLTALLITEFTCYHGAWGRPASAVVLPMLDAVRGRITGTVGAGIGEKGWKAEPPCAPMAAAWRGKRQPHPAPT